MDGSTNRITQKQDQPIKMQNQFSLLALLLNSVFTSAAEYLKLLAAGHIMKYRYMRIFKSFVLIKAIAN